MAIFRTWATKRSKVTPFFKLVEYLFFVRIEILRYIFFLETKLSRRFFKNT